MSRKLVRVLWCWWLGALVLLGVSASAQNARMDRPPRLVVQLVMGGVRADALEVYWERLDPRGIPRLVGRGTYCTNARQSHLVGGEASGAATLVSGASPSVHGVNAGYWFPRIQAGREYLVADKSERGVGSDGRRNGYSPRRMLVGTLGDAWRGAYPDAKIYALSLTPVPGVVLGGRGADGVFWYDAKGKAMVSSSYYGAVLPEAIRGMNDAQRPSQACEQAWVPLLPAKEMRAVRLTANRRGAYAAAMQGVAQEVDKRGVMPERDAPGGKPMRLLYAPSGNSLLKTVAVALIEGEQIGKDDTPDLLSVYFSSLAGVNMLYGPESPQAEDALLRFNGEVADLIDYLDVAVGSGQYLVVLTSAYASEESPSYLDHLGIPHGTFSPQQALFLLNAYLGALYPHSKLAKGCVGQQIYLDELAIEKLGTPLEEVEARAARFLRDMVGVSRVYTSTQLLQGEVTQGRMGRAQMGFHAKRSGNLIVDLQPGWIVESPTVPLAENTSCSYADRVPLVWYGWKLRAIRSPEPVHLEDVAPTLCELLHITPPNAAMGSPIGAVVGWTK